MRQQDIAYGLAETAHRGQFRRDGITPYFYHCMDVAAVAMRRGGRDLEVATALLHDTIEDHRLSFVEMKNAGICEEVMNAVQLLTLNKEFTYEQNIRIIKDSGNKLAIAVKIADNLANLADDPTDKQILKYAKSLQILTSNE